MEEEPENLIWVDRLQQEVGDPQALGCRLDARVARHDCHALVRGASVVAHLLEEVLACHIDEPPVEDDKTPGARWVAKMLKPFRTGVDGDSIETDGLDENLERVAKVAVVLDDECSMAVVIRHV